MDTSLVTLNILDTSRNSILDNEHPWSDKKRLNWALSFTYGSLDCTQVKTERRKLFLVLI